jgi:hypothetical protein
MADEYYVYVLFDRHGIPFYVGMGKGKRWLEHEYGKNLKKPFSRNSVIKETVATLGEVPKIKIAERLSHTEAIALEITFIAAIGRRPGGPLYNISPGGDGVNPESAQLIAAKLKGRKQSPELVSKRIAARLLNGRKIRVTPEAIAARAAGHRGLKRSPETRARMSAAQKGRTFTDEQRQKISKTLSGRKLSPERAAKSAKWRAEMWADPERAAAHRAKIRAAWAAKREKPK